METEQWSNAGWASCKSVLPVPLDNCGRKCLQRCIGCSRHGVHLQSCDGTLCECQQALFTLAVHLITPCIVCCVLLWLCFVFSVLLYLCIVHNYRRECACGLGGTAHQTKTHIQFAIVRPRWMRKREFEGADSPLRCFVCWSGAFWAPIPDY